jgi:hypothetical protein
LLAIADIGDERGQRALPNVPLDRIWRPGQRILYVVRAVGVEKDAAADRREKLHELLGFADEVIE